MKSIKGHFIRTNILMVVISMALVILMSFILISVFFLNLPDGFQKLIDAVREVFYGQESENDAFIFYTSVWAILTGVLVLCTCIALSANLARTVLAPINRLKKGAVNIAEGELDFDVLTCDEGEELSELCDAIEEIRKRLKENEANEKRAAEERNMLVANLSHDMRTPITAIKGYVEGIKDGVADTPEKRDRYLDTIYGKTILLEKLLDNMTEYSEMELGRMQYALEFMDITAYLRDLAEEYQPDIEEKGMKFSAELLSEPLIIVADRNKLKRVLDNLISNAVKYNVKEGTIMLSQETDGKGVIICVSDTGTGIEKKDLDRVFDGFYRADTARSNIKGSGLGLAIAKQIVESHRGKIWIKSGAETGTQVCMYLPLRNKDL